jgi:hypothetical protein
MNNMNLTITPIFNDDCSAIIGLILPIQQIEFNVPFTIEDQLSRGRRQFLGSKSRE